MCDAIMDGLSDRGFSPGWRKDFEKRVDIAKQAGLDIAGAKWPRVRRKAHKAANAMAELIGELPPSMAIDFQNTRQKLELLTTAEGPDPRTSPQDWVLAFLGWRFVEQHSPDRPVTTQGGNVHAVVCALFEAVTGAAASDGQFLRAIKAVAKYCAGEGQPPQVRVKAYIRNAS
jgi:hypothetical protein